MNSMQVKDKLKNIAALKNINFNTALKFYVFDRFIVRMSKSEYKDNFVIKGGFLLSVLFGLENRSTMDIDSMITKITFTKENIFKMVNSIINIDLNDNIKFIIQDISLIRDEDEYGGYRINLIFEFEKIKENLKLDVATGDPITPYAISYSYKTMLENTSINIWSYNIETILAEKLETIFSKLEVSSRMKDYYDIYLIYHKDWENINLDILRKAVLKTFSKRNFNDDLDEAFRIIKDSLILRKRWNIYSKKYEYSNGIIYEDVIKCIEKIVLEINGVKI